MKAFGAHSLFIIGEQAVHLLDLLVHLLCLGDGLHDLDKTQELYTALFIVIILLNKLLHFFIRQVHIEAAK